MHRLLDMWSADQSRVEEAAGVLRGMGLLLAVVLSAGCGASTPTPIPTPDPTPSATPTPSPEPTATPFSCPPFEGLGARVYHCTTPQHQISEDTRGLPLPVVGGSCVIDTTPFFPGRMTCEKDQRLCACERPPDFKVIENPGARVSQEHPFQLVFRQLVPGTYVTKISLGEVGNTVRFEVR